MADVELLPLPEPVVWITDESVDAIKSVHGKDSPYGIHGLTCKYAKCVNPLYSAETVDALQAEIERLRAEVERLRADRDSWEQQASDRVADWHAVHLRAERLAEALRWAERHCPCGARPESPDTHPHLPGCLVGAALAQEDRND